MPRRSPTDPHQDAAAESRAALETLLRDPACAGLRRRLEPAALERMARYVALLLGVNRRLNLTRITDPAEVARLHLLDSLAALPLVDELAPARALDLGSGGGLPAIPLALARPETRWTLVESIGKKAAALSEMVGALGLGTVSVEPQRAETLGQDAKHRQRYQLVTARACAPLPVLVELALPLLATGGGLLAWKGPLADDDDEVRRGRLAAGQLGGGRLRILPTGLPALGGHTVVAVSKLRPTPRRFPRRPGEPSRRPLG